MSAGLSVFTMEVRKKMSYRVDFWLHLLGSVAAQLGVAYFLWRAVFEVQQVDTMGGYSFEGLMLYYLLVAIMSHLVRGPRHGYISRDIYEGGINRFLVYPIGFFYFKAMGYAGSSCFYVLQLLLAMAICVIIFGVPDGVNLQPSTLLMGLISAVMSACLYFLFICALELVAFWSDQVWGLLEMLRMVSVLLGGALIPLSFFPEWAEHVCHLLPFAYLFAFPVETMLGKHDVATWAEALLIAMLWCALLSLIVRSIWIRGLRQYTGIGM